MHLLCQQVVWEEWEAFKKVLVQYSRKTALSRLESAVFLCEDFLMSDRLPKSFIKKHKVLWITLIVVMGGIFGIWFAKAELLSFALTAKTGVRMTVSDWDMNLHSMHFKNFRIRTPKDPVYPNAFKVDEIIIEAGLFDMLKRAAHINSITVNNVFLGINIKADGSSNWGSVIEKLSSGSPDAGSSDKNKSKSKESKSTFVIDQFDVNNVLVGMNSPKGKKEYGPTSINLRNVGAHQSMSLDGLIRTVVVEISSAMVSKYAIPMLFKGIGKVLGKTILAPFKLFAPRKESKASSDSSKKASIPDLSPEVSSEDSSSEDAPFEKDIPINS